MTLALARPAAEPPPPTDADGSPPVPLDILLDIATGLAAQARLSPPTVDPAGSSRLGSLLLVTETYEAWLLVWPRGTAIEPHDHGESHGVFVVAAGHLTETRWEDGRPNRWALAAGDAAVVRVGEVHRVEGTGDEPAVSVHVYSPPLDEMRFYADDGRGLVGVQTVGGVPTPAAPADSAVDRRLAAARRRLGRRVQPGELAGEVDRGSLVIDIRPVAQRARDGSLPGATVVERNDLEWRLDATGLHRLPDVDRADRRVVLLCDEGYASSLAAGALLDLGLTDVTDLDGGFQAWRRLTDPPDPTPTRASGARWTSVNSYGRARRRCLRDG